jgi:hypothetical protein
VQDGEAPNHGMTVLRVSETVLMDYKHHEELWKKMRDFSRDALVQASRNSKLPQSQENTAQVFCRRLLQVFIPQKMAWGYKRTTHGQAIGHLWYTNRQQAMLGKNCDCKNVTIF